MDREPALTCGRPAARSASRSAQTDSTLLAKRRCSGRSAGCAKPARS
jgi:hypothetical protein